MYVQPWHYFHTLSETCRDCGPALAFGLTTIFSFALFLLGGFLLMGLYNIPE